MRYNLPIPASDDLRLFMAMPALLLLWRVFLLLPRIWPAKLLHSYGGLLLLSGMKTMWLSDHVFRERTLVLGPKEAINRKFELHAPSLVTHHSRFGFLWLMVGVTVDAAPTSQMDRKFLLPCLPPRFEFAEHLLQRSSLEMIGFTPSWLMSRDAQINFGLSPSQIFWKLIRLCGPVCMKPN